MIYNEDCSFRRYFGMKDFFEALKNELIFLWENPQLCFIMFTGALVVAIIANILKRL